MDVERGAVGAFGDEPELLGRSLDRNHLEFTIEQLWHERVHGDPARVWLRRCIARCSGNRGAAAARDARR